MTNNNTRHIKVFLILITILFVVLRLGLFAYDLIQKNNSKKNQYNSNVTVVNISPIGNFPAGLIPPDALNIVDSYKATSIGEKTQYTYKYISAKDMAGSMFYFDNWTSKNGWKQQDVFVDTEKGFYTLSALKDGVFMSVVVNQNKNGKGSIVDITLIK